MLKVSDRTTSARGKAASASPMAWLKPTATLVPHSGWTRGPPGSAARTMSTTGGSGSHSTSISATASSARARLSATTIATISPTWRARSRQRANCPAWRRSNVTAAARPGGAAPKSGSGFIQRSRSLYVKTAATPDSAFAAAVWIRAMRAWAWGERTNAAWSMEGSVTSSTNRPSPRRNRGSSRRFTAAPKYFAPISPPRPRRDYTPHHDGRRGGPHGPSPGFPPIASCAILLPHMSTPGRVSMPKRWTVLFALVVATLMAATVFVEAQAPIKLGVIQPLSGPVAASGNYVRMGAEIARDWLNAKGGINGRKVELVIEDNKSDPKEAASAAEKLIVRDKVPAIMGAWGSSMTLAAMPKLEEYGVPMVVETSSAASVTKRGNPWVFRISPPSEMEALGLEQYIDKLGVKKADFLAVNTDWGRGSITAFGDMLRKKGVQVGAAEFMEQAATDMNAQLTKIKQTGGDTLFLTTAVEQITLVLKQGQEQRLARKIITTGGSSSPTQLIKQAGAAAEGSYHIVFFMPWFQEALWKVSFTGVNGPIKFEKDGPAGKESGQSKPSIFIVQVRDGKVALPDFLKK